MFATDYDVLELTGSTVTEEVVLMASAIIEVACGRNENFVSDYYDQEWLRYATAFQAAYMADDGAVFQQANVAAVTQNDSRIVFGDRLYALAPLAAEALKRLTWRGSRSITTGSLNGQHGEECWDVA